MLAATGSLDPGIVAAFGGGMLSFISPCVLPLVPGYLSLMSGISTAQLTAPTGDDRHRIFRSTLLFIAGFTVVFVALGAGASALGSFLIRNQETFTRIAGGFVIVMGLFMAGLVAVPALQRERRIHVQASRLGPWAAPLMGMAFAFGWTPCIGPILAPILAFAASEGTYQRGIVLLLGYSAGLAVPFVLTGLLFQRMAGTLGWVKGHYRVINLTSGVLLALFGLLLLTSTLGRVSGWIIEFFDAIHLDFLTRI